MEVSNVKGFESVSKAENVLKEVKVKQPKVDLSNPVDTVEFSKNVEDLKATKKTKAKKVKAGIASACIPGLGQFLNGDKMKGLQIMAGHVGIVGYVAAATALAATGAVAALPAVAIGTVILTVYDIASIIDAVKTAK